MFPQIPFNFISPKKSATKFVTSNLIIPETIFEPVLPNLPLSNSWANLTSQQWKSITQDEWRSLLLNPINLLEWQSLTTDQWKSITQDQWRSISESNSSGVAGNDSDVINVITAIEATGVTLNINQKNAITNRIISAKSNGVWNKLIAYYGFVGGTAASHAINWKNPNTYNIIWNGTVTHNANGVQGDGISGYGNTGINTNTTLSFGNCGLGYYLTQGKNSSSYDCGCDDGLNSFKLALRSRVCELELGFSVISNFLNKPKRYFSGSKINYTGKLYFDGVVFAINSLTRGNVLPNTNLFLCCSSSNGVPSSFSVARFGSFMLNIGLTDSQESSNFTSELEFQTALSR